MIDLRDGIPWQFKGKPNMETLLNAFETEMQEVEKTFTQLNTLRWFDTSEGKQLDGIGDIVVMTRKRAWDLVGLDHIIMDDKRYTVFLKWKALKNITNCTFPQFVQACKMMYNPKYIYYHEDTRYPATMFVQIGANLDEETLELMRNALLFIKPAGVALKVDVFALQFFGFSDTNENALGFSEGKFATELITI